MRKVYDIARWFVMKEAMTHEKLQGMVYLSYAWFYTLNLQDLFETEGFEALPIMPAEMELSSKYHSYGNKKIKAIKGEKLPKDIEVFLESVYDTYKIADGEALCAYLRDSTPYKKARARQTKISREDMKSYYEYQQR